MSIELLTATEADANIQFNDFQDMIVPIRPIMVPSSKKNTIGTAAIYGTGPPLSIISFGVMNHSAQASTPKRKPAIAKDAAVGFDIPHAIGPRSCGWLDFTKLHLT